MPNKAQRSRGSGFKRETDLLRRVDTRRERRSVLVVTNGVSTEVDYFDALRREPWIRADKVKVKFVPGEPAAIVLRAASIRDDNAYDEAWVVCDVDEFDLKSAVTTAAEREVELALSVPCFEIWLILHLSAGCPRFNNATQVSRHLKNLLPNWEKTGLKFSDFSAGIVGYGPRASAPDLSHLALVGQPAQPEADPRAGYARCVHPYWHLAPSSGTSDSTTQSVGRVGDQVAGLRACRVPHAACRQTGHIRHELQHQLH